MLKVIPINMPDGVFYNDETEQFVVKCDAEMYNLTQLFTAFGYELTQAVRYQFVNCAGEYTFKRFATNTSITLYLREGCFLRVWGSQLFTLDFIVHESFETLTAAERKFFKAVLR